jgi:hypothetical protein
MFMIVVTLFDYIRFTTESSISFARCKNDSHDMVVGHCAPGDGKTARLRQDGGAARRFRHADPGFLRQRRSRDAVGFFFLMYVGIGLPSRYVAKLRRNFSHC